MIRKDVGRDMLNNWHYHPEIELLFIKRSSGTWLIGDHIGHFKSGDIVLLGADLPHCFRHENDSIIKGGETICVKILPELLGDAFLSLPEAKMIKELFSKCKSGLKIVGKTKGVLQKVIEKMVNASPGKKLIYLLAILEEIAEGKQYITLSSKGFTQIKGDCDKDRIRLVFDYTFARHHEKIILDDVAALLHMTKQSFCRYFKNKTQKTYVRFLMEVRIGYACQLLVEDEKNVTEICYECGYNDLSHFNHQFKMITNRKPLEYKRDYLNQN
ncbi:MAG: AraC family transcriptional regulator [Bacteroidota bacterium]|nr:AraC family transcriptional regulator [Bacteroidota bacterium]